MDPDELLDGLTAGETRKLVSALERRGLVPRPVAKSEDEILLGVSPEMRAAAETARAALATRFNVPAEDVAIVPLAGTQAVGVLLSTVNGLNRGSWDEIFAVSEPGEFVVDLGGVACDTRAGMTWDLYLALVERAKALGVSVLPDSSAGPEADDQPSTCTLLTGEAMDDGRAPFAFVNDDEVGRSWGSRGNRSGLRFRPAVVLEAVG